MLLSLATVVPTVLYVTLLWWLDKYEKEPWGLFLAAFGYGFLPAVILSVILELALEMPASEVVQGGAVIGPRLVAPIVEETVKSLALLLIFFFWRREFDGVMDGIVYGAVVGFGFGMTENLLYFLETGGDPAVILLRSVPFGLNHALFTSFTGVGLGLARLSKRRWAGFALFPLALLAAITFHAIHNSTVELGCPGMAAAAVADWGGVAVILVVAILSWRQEKRWIQQELQEEVAVGVLATADYQALLSLSRRVGARLWMWRHHGWRAFRLLGKFLNLSTELAFHKHHLREGTARGGGPEVVETLRHRVQTVRCALLSRMEAS
jgi:RsiW-degrading membrane proteinase PrsW (M82 family)